jgi:hypothetical protein
MEEIFAKYERQPEKLANLKSTQVNENFNAIVSTKARKNHHLSGSEALDIRISAAVAQKHIGYVSEVSCSLDTNTAFIYRI